MTQEILRTPTSDWGSSDNREFALSTLTKVRLVHPNLQELVERQTLPDWGRELLRQALADGKNIIIGGRVCSGKTTLLGALVRECPSLERMMLVDSDRELAPRFRNMPNVASYREEVLSISQLMRIFADNAPERLVVGEIRGAEAYDYMHAITQARNAYNFRGMMFTMHTDAAREIMKDFMHCVDERQAKPLGSLLRNQLMGTIDLMIYVRKYPSYDGYGKYVVDRIVAVGGEAAGNPEYKTLLRYNHGQQRFELGDAS